MTVRIRRWMGLLVLPALLVLSGCGATLPEIAGTQANRHIEVGEQTDSGDIPDVVNPLPLVTAPQPQESPELYSLVAQDWPIRELMFAMGRDANINIDIHPSITGQVSINAIDQTLPQILERISRQVDMRYSFDANNNLLVEPDSPYWESYRIDYVNVDRSAQTQATVSTALTSVAGTGGAAGNNNSTSLVNQTSANNFWASLTENLTSMLSVNGANADSENTGVVPLVVNRETGIVSVFANSREHRQVEAFLDFVQTRSLHQVLIEATIVEVNLNDNYQSGVDWAALRSDNFDFSFVQNLTGGNLNNPPTNILTIADSDNNDAVTGTIKLLSQFGDLRVLSSPKIMALNNQSALLRVVDNKVYFTVEVEPGAVTQGVASPPVFTTEVQTVPVGFVMSVTPQVGDGDQVTLNVRPTISRIVRFVDDPSPVLAEAGVTNSIPEIQIQEMESVLKVYSGQVAVLGGLMQDSLQLENTGLPGVSRLPRLGNLFSSRTEQASKTELIIFIRSQVIRQPSLSGDLRQFSDFLPRGGLPFNPSPSFGTSASGQGP